MDLCSDSFSSKAPFEVYGAIICPAAYMPWKSICVFYQRVGAGCGILIAFLQNANLLHREIVHH